MHQMLAMIQLDWCILTNYLSKRNGEKTRITGIKWTSKDLSRIDRGVFMWGNFCSQNNYIVQCFDYNGVKFLKGYTVDSVQKWTGAIGQQFEVTNS